MRIRRMFAAVAALFIATQSGHAASGDADRQFGTNGITFIDFTPVSGAPAHTFDAATAVDAQGRVWAIASVQGSAGFGLGLARLTRNGKLDPTFGTGGRIYLPAPPTLFYTIIGLRIGADGSVYAAYSQGSGASTVWNICRLAENGGFDPTFFGGCDAPNLNDAVGGDMDLQISPTDGSVWVLGNAHDTSSGRDYADAVVLGGTSNAQAIIHAQHLYSYTVSKAAFDSAGTLYFTGTSTTSGNANVLLGAFTESDGFIQSAKLNEIVLDVGGTLADHGRCIAVAGNGEPIVGASADAGNDVVEWATVKFQTTTGYPLDTTYGSGGKTVEAIVNGIYDEGRGHPDSALKACALSAEGALNMAGSYSYIDPNNMGDATALALHRLHPDGSDDQNFAGDVPGIAYGIAYAGTVLDFLRAPNNGSHTDVPATLTPYGGTLVVSVISTRLNATGYSDLAVLRAFGDGIFNADSD